MQRKAIGLLMGTALALAFGVHDASAKRLQVGTCTTNPLQYTTIQAAVSAAQTGDTVQVCPGTYPEQVSITTSIALTNVPTMSDPTVAIPAGGGVQNTALLGSSYPAIAQIVVSGVKATVKNLIVDGTGNDDTSCGVELLGIYFQNAGGAIEGDTAQNQMLPAGYQGCQDGEGIFVESQTAGTAALTISGNTVTNFDKNGITVSYGAANAAIKNNTVTGIGPTDVIAQNGIQLGYEATGSITGNTVSNLVYTGGTYGSSGILLYDIQAGSDLANPQVVNNNVSNAQYGVVLDAVDGSSGALVPVSRNTISGASFAGIGLYSDPYVPSDDNFIKVSGNNVSGTNPYDDIDACSDNNTIASNTVNTSTEGGIHLDGLCPVNSVNSGINNTVSGNKIDNNCVGILSGPAQGSNTITRTNSFMNNTNNYEYGTDSFSCGAKHRGTSKHLVPVVSIKPLRH